jgi:ribosomal protein S17E
MTSLFKRLFWKKKESNSMNLKNILMEKIEYFKSLDENQISGLRKTQNFLKTSNSDGAEFMHEFIDAGLEIHELKKAEKIVNEYGQALEKGSEINKLIVEKITSDQMLESLENKDAYYYALQNKFDISLLPYDKTIIKDAIELLLEDETDSSKKDGLMIGLRYLEDFVEIDKS